MAKQQKARIPKSATTSKSSIPDAIKSELETKAAKLIGTSKGSGLFDCVFNIVWL